MNDVAIRKTYMMRFVGRVFVLICCIAYCFLRPMQLKVMTGMEFFKDITLLHVLWLVWMIDMAMQLFPVKVKTSIGSQKNFKKWYRPAESYDMEGLQDFTKTLNKRALVLFVIWVIFIGIIGMIYHKGYIGNAVILVFATAFYLCDLICVLFWCPFRLYLGNKCCTTCRIFNWDHFMMFTPFVFIPGFFTWSLLGVAVLVMVIWEVTVRKHPERFWETSNDTLKCKNCTDKLCTPYCGKLPKRNVG